MSIAVLQSRQKVSVHLSIVKVPGTMLEAMSLFDATMHLLEVRSTFLEMSKYFVRPQPLQSVFKGWHWRQSATEHFTSLFELAGGKAAE